MKTILVVFGGRSVEHDISIITGQVIIEALQAASQYNVLPLYIARDGKWYSHPDLAKIETFKEANLSDKLAKLPQLADKSDDGLVLVETGRFGAKSQPIDLVFPAMHGTHGEDGSLMGLLKMAGVPFVGCDLAASAIAMDKVLCKQVTEAVGVPSVPYTWFTAHDYAKGQTEILKQIKKFTLPVFVKGVHLGSSIGVFRVNDWEELEDQIEVALHYDDKIIVEQGIKQLVEINCAIIGNDEPTIGLLERPRGSEELLSFEDKYISSGGTQGGGAKKTGEGITEIPAQIPDKQAEEIRRLARLAWHACGLSGISRLDFMIDQADGKVYLTEINPLPGTISQHIWRKSGVSSVDLVTRLVDYAEQRFAAQQKLTTTFNSSVLANARGGKIVSS